MLSTWQRNIKSWETNKPDRLFLTLLKTTALVDAMMSLLTVLNNVHFWRFKGMAWKPHDAIMVIESYVINIEP